MGKLRMISMVFFCLLAAGNAIPANAAISNNYSANQKEVTFGGESATRSSHQSTGLFSDEVLLIGAAVIGLIGISIMRKTLH